MKKNQPTLPGLRQSNATQLLMRYLLNAYADGDDNVREAIVNGAIEILAQTDRYCIKDGKTGEWIA